MYGNVVIVIAKRRNVDLSVYAIEKPSLQGSYESKFLQNIDFRLSKKGWMRDEVPESYEDPDTRKGKRKAGPTTKCR